jgi:predicted GNAT family acetyltransferase
MEISAQHRPDRKRFEIQIGDDTAYAEYVDAGRTLVLTHTFVPPALRGKGLAAILVRNALDFARKEGKKVAPQCSYAAAYLDQHPEYHDLREQPSAEI